MKSKEEEYFNTLFDIAYAREKVTAEELRKIAAKAIGIVAPGANYSREDYPDLFALVAPTLGKPVGFLEESN